MVKLTTLIIHTAFSILGTGAVNLYAACSDGNLTTLALTTSGRNSSLSIVGQSKECAANPSWLTLESGSRILYCLDRGKGSAVNGSLNSFQIESSGSLTRIDRADVPAAGVYMYPFGFQKRGIAAVSYNRSALAVLEISKDGQIDGPLQSIFPTIEDQGPISLRQDRSYLHQVQPDPTGRYLLAMDLGGDRIRVFTFDNATLRLTEQESLQTDPGVGPRHGVFWRSPRGALFFIFVGEISQKVYTYQIRYEGGRMSLTKVHEIFGLGDDREKPTQTSPLSAIVLSPDNRFLIVSNRDISFRNSTQFASSNTDTLSNFRINADGSLRLLQLAPSGGWSPRDFSFNKAGDRIAVGHQNNNTVVIWERDVATGLLLPEAEGGKLAVATLTGAVVRTIWDE